MVLWLAVIGVGILTALLMRVGMAHFQREALLGREIDVLNLRWIGSTFWRAFRGGATSLLAWYRTLVRETLRKQAKAILLTILVGLISLAGGYIWLSNHSAELTGSISAGDFSRILASGLGAPRGTGIEISFPMIWGHNLQAIVIILLLGLFSFGVLGALIYVLNMGVVGAALALVKALGHSPLLVGLLGILPHGIFEIPALILASSAIVYFGAVLVTPRPQKTLGEVLIEAVADWMKIGLGLVLPLLTIAAIVEAWITPVLLSSVLR